jgi:hypothetical protein
MSEQLNYAAMTGGDLLATLGMDGMKWAQAFRQINPDCSVEDDTMLGWFCNAIMAGYDHAHGNPPLCGDHAQWLLENGA